MAIFFFNLTPKAQATEAKISGDYTKPKNLLRNERNHPQKLAVYMKNCLWVRILKIAQTEKDTQHIVVTFGKILDLAGNIVKDVNILSILIHFKENLLTWNYILI